MSLTLNLGVVDVPYENAGKNAPKGKKRKRGAGSSRGAPVTTVEVATFLEEKYGVMQAYVDRHSGDISGALVHSLEGALENLYLGAPVVAPFDEAGQAIAAGFRQFLLTAEIESMGIEGVPTQAAIERRSLRFKSRQGPNSRPSFIDTSTYEMSMRAWIEE